MAASSLSSQLWLLPVAFSRTHACHQASTSSGSLPLPRLNVQQQFVQSQVNLAGQCSWLRLNHSSTVEMGLGPRRGKLQRQDVVAYARKPGKDRNGGVAQALEEVQLPPLEGVEPDDTFNGRRLDGLEPNFWEGDKWNTFGFIMQYLWALGIGIAVVACGVAVTSYNSGAIDIRDTAVFKEAIENPLEAIQEGLENLSEPGNTLDFPDISEAPLLEK